MQRPRTLPAVVCIHLTRWRCHTLRRRATAIPLLGPSLVVPDHGIPPLSSRCHPARSATRDLHLRDTLRHTTAPETNRFKFDRQSGASTCASWGASPTNSTLPCVATHTRQRRTAALRRRRQWFLLSQNTHHTQGIPAVSNITAA